MKSITGRMQRAVVPAMGTTACRNDWLRIEQRRTSGRDPKCKQQVGKRAAHEQKDCTTSQRLVMSSANAGSIESVGLLTPDYN